MSIRSHDWADGNILVSFGNINFIRLETSGPVDIEPSDVEAMAKHFGMVDHKAALADKEAELENVEHELDLMINERDAGVIALKKTGELLERAQKVIASGEYKIDACVKAHDIHHDIAAYLGDMS